MARLPDGWVLKPIITHHNHGLQVVLQTSELITCKDCKYWDEEDTIDGSRFCPNTGCWEPPNFYCADAERRADNA